MFTTLFRKASSSLWYVENDQMFCADSQMHTYSYTLLSIPLGSIWHTNLVLFQLIMTDACFRCSFISADPLVVTYMLFSLLLNLNTHYSQCPHRTCINSTLPPSFESIHSFHPFVNFTSFHTL